MRLEEISCKESLVLTTPLHTLVAARLHSYDSGAIRDPWTAAGQLQGFVLDGSVHKCDRLTASDVALIEIVVWKLWSDKAFLIENDLLKVVREWNRRVRDCNAWAEMVATTPFEINP